MTDDAQTAHNSAQIEQAIVEQDQVASNRAFGERVLAAAVRRCIKKDNPALAIALLESQVTAVEPWQQMDFEPTMLYAVELATSEQGMDLLTYFNPGNKVRDEWPGNLTQLFDEALPPGMQCGIVQLGALLEEVEPGWREAAYASLQQSERNQGNLISQAPRTYNGLRYRSYSEIVLAKELDSRGVLFFPLPAASRGGIIREPDFMVVHRGVVGILEVHGEPYHPASRAAHDHKRNLFFRESGIVVEVFDAKEVRENTKLVVDKFLGLLRGPTR